MTVRTITTVAAAVVAMAPTGCASNSTGTDRHEAATEQATSARASLSPVARDLLGRAEALVGSVAGTVHSYARGSMNDTVLQQRLHGERVRADALVDDAQALPKSDPAREQIVGLLTALQMTLERLRSGRTGERVLNAALQDLQQQAKSVLHRFGI